VERYLYIAAGAALGANARYLVGTWAGNRWGAFFPFGTLIVNVTGSLLLGFLVGLATDRVMMSPEMRLFLAVGFMGSYTTFSSYTVESLALLQAGAIWPALLNIVGNNALGLGCAVLGFAFAQVVGG
jgi:CrcB protein